MDTQTPTTMPIISREIATKFGKLALECTKCSETDAKDGYILTLKHESSSKLKTPFGLKITPIKHTFYMKSSEVCEVGFKADMNINDFRVVERMFEFPDDETGEVKQVWCKWLHIPS